MTLCRLLLILALLPSVALAQSDTTGEPPLHGGGPSDPWLHGPPDPGQHGPPIEVVDPGDPVASTPRLADVGTPLSAAQAQIIRGQMLRRAHGGLPSWLLGVRPHQPAPYWTNPGGSGLGNPPPPTPGPQQDVFIPVYVHVVTDQAGAGDLPDSTVQAWIAVLDEAFSASRYFFDLVGIEHVANDAWHTASPFSPAEAAMMEALHVASSFDDVVSPLNVYVIDPPQGELGWASFPWFYPLDDAHDGVVIMGDTAPGGTAVPYTDGKQLVHEVGHWMGLFHTFQGGCRGSGDFVDDTNPEPDPLYSCSPVTSCGGRPADPSNFMQYTDDACMDHFTAGQFERIEQVFATYRVIP